MGRDYLITNEAILIKEAELFLLQSTPFGHIYISSGAAYHKTEDLTVYIHGYLQPRKDNFQEYSGYNSLDLIVLLYKKYKDGFISFVKGIFTIIIIRDEEVHLFTDHLGLQKCFTYKNGKINAISNTCTLFTKIGFEAEPVADSLAVKTLLNRIPGKHTCFKNIERIPGGTRLLITNSISQASLYWEPGLLLNGAFHDKDELSYSAFAQLIKENFRNFLSFIKPDINAITLTGGKDCRTGLAALKANGVTPYGFTYGNPLSRDAIYASILAKEISLPYNILMPPDTIEWFNSAKNEILNSGDPDISLHRAHRLFAFKETAAKLSATSAYYAGYMAGELLMGVYYDNLVFTRYLTESWDNSIRPSHMPLFDDCFLKPDSVCIHNVISIITDLRTFDSSILKKEQQFYGIFEIGIPHHGQDILLAGRYFNYVYPFFMDIDLLEILFRSRFNFFFTDNKTSNLLDRYKLFELNMNIQHILFPEMDNVPFGKKGSYNTKEFLSGKYYLAIIKTLRYLFQRNRYPVNYSYSNTYKDFLLEHLNTLNSERDNILHVIYDVPKAITTLRAVHGDAGEGALQRFSNIVMLDQQIKRFNQ